MQVKVLGTCPQSSLCIISMVTCRSVVSFPGHTQQEGLSAVPGLGLLPDEAGLGWRGYGASPWAPGAMWALRGCAAQGARETFTPGHLSSLDPVSCCASATPSPRPPPHTAYGGRGRSPAAGAVSALPLGLLSAALFWNPASALDRISEISDQETFFPKTVVFGRRACSGVAFRDLSMTRQDRRP